MASEPQGQEAAYEPRVAKLLGIKSGVSKDGVGSATMLIRDDHLQDAGAVQGGLIVSLADHALYLAAKSRLRPGQASTTVELKVNFTAPAKDGELTATARVLSAGRRIIVAEVSVINDRQVLIAQGLGTTLVLENEP